MEILSYNLQDYVVFVDFDDNQTQKKLLTRRISDIKVPDGTKFFVTFSLPEVNIEVKGTKQTLTGTPINESGYFFMTGVVYTPEEFIAKYPHNLPMFHKINSISEKTGHELNIIEIDNQFFPFRKNDKIYDPNIANKNG